MNRIIKAISDPKRTLRFFCVSAIQKCHYLLPNTLCVKLLYRLYFGEKLNLVNPKTFNEKLNWLKVFYHNPLCTRLADKYEVKEYVRSLIGDEHVVLNYGVWNSFDEININSLPNQFVLKSTHDSGGVLICRDKSHFNVEIARKQINKTLSKNFYYMSWEWPYKNITPRIIVDEYLNDGRAGELQDYKFWCFDGVPKYIYITNKGNDIFENFYDMDFNPVDINHGFPRYKPEYVKPNHFEEMKEYAALLSKNIPFVRIDFFIVNDCVYFGEYTFYDWGGERPFITKEMDLKLGQLLQLPSPVNPD